MAKKGSTLDCEEAILNTDITFIATATPSHRDGSINLKHIKNSTREIAEALDKKEVIEVKR